MTTRSTTDPADEVFAAVEAAPVRIISARGSTEPQSGSRLLRPIARAVAHRSPIPVAYTELAYPATFRSFEAGYPARFDLGDSPRLGVTALLALLEDNAHTRPGQDIVLLGWSQGAQVIGDTLDRPEHRLAARDAPALSAATAARIAAIALYGNPRFTAGQPYNAGSFDPSLQGTNPRLPGALSQYGNRMRDYCAADDLACQVGPNSTLDGHTSYFINTMRADGTTFVLQQLAARRRRQAPAPTPSDRPSEPVL
jgi:cutinase